MKALSSLSIYCVFAALTLLAPCTAHAQPTVTLSAEAQNRFHSVIFTFVQNDLPSMNGCHYNLFAADKPGDLTTLPGKGISIATFFKEASFVQIIANPLPHLAQVLGKSDPKIKKRVKVYFRTLLSCPSAENGLGELISVTMKTFPGGKLTSVDRLTKKMKYNMQYYEPPTS